jgi:hypothetical protein
VLKPWSRNKPSPVLFFPEFHNLIFKTESHFLQAKHCQKQGGHFEGCRKGRELARSVSNIAVHLAQNFVKQTKKLL